MNIIRYIVTLVWLFFQIQPCLSQITDTLEGYFGGSEKLATYGDKNITQITDGDSVIRVEPHHIKDYWLPSGKQSGITKEYFKNGNVKIEGTLSGPIQCDFKETDSLSKRETPEKFLGESYSEPIGKWKEYYEDGKVKKEYEYQGCF